MKREIEYYDTFVTNNGSLDQRINNATGLSGKNELLDVMAKRRNNVAKDLLVENICSQKCVACYYQEDSCKQGIRISEDKIADVRKAIENLTVTNKDLFTFYPREITTAMNFLPLYTELLQDRVLTNGKLLNKSVFEKFKKSGIKRLSITVPGEKEAYSFYTQEPESTYDQLLENVSNAVTFGFNVSAFMPLFKQNIKDVTSTVRNLANRGVKEIQFIRIVPEGQAKSLSDAIFIDREDTLSLMRNVNSLRHELDNKVHLSLFKGYFGPNFYGNSIFKHLSGQINEWPGSEYFCPAINRQFLCVSAQSNNIYNCFASMSFPEDFMVGKYDEGVIETTKMPIKSEELKDALRGICSSNACEEQPVCMGGCRVIPYAIAKRNGEPNPMFAGQDFCITQILKEISK